MYLLQHFHLPMEELRSLRKNLLQFSMSNTRILLHSHSNRKAGSIHHLTLRSNNTRRHSTANRNTPSILNSRLIRTFKLNSNFHLGLQVDLIHQVIRTAVLLHLSLAADLARHMRRPHLISHLWQLIRRQHLHPLYRVRPHMEFN